MSMRKDLAIIFSHQNNKASRFTPRELIKYHIEHPEIPITDKDIENLVLDFSSVSNQSEEYQSFNKNNGNNYLNNNNNFTKLM
jgi:hypothetical protein